MIIPFNQNFNPIALRKAKTVYQFGLSECDKIKSFHKNQLTPNHIVYFVLALNVLEMFADDKNAYNLQVTIKKA